MTVGFAALAEGRSALLNVLAAEKVSEGPAEVHARAGWTATLSFYRIEPPDAALFDPAYAGVAAMEDEERFVDRARSFGFAHRVV